MLHIIPSVCSMPCCAAMLPGLRLLSPFLAAAPNSAAGPCCAGAAGLLQAQVHAARLPQPCGAKGAHARYQQLHSVPGKCPDSREFAMEMSLTSLGSSQTLRRPQPSTEAASLFCSLSDTCSSERAVCGPGQRMPSAQAMQLQHRR